MSHFTEHPEIYDQPICLSAEAIRDPMSTIRDFFADYRLSEIREIQDQVQTTCMIANGPFFSGREAWSKLLPYNEKLIGLLEAASRLQELLPAPDKTSTADRAMIKPVPFNRELSRLAEIAKGLHAATAETATLCLIIFKAWTAQAVAQVNPTPSQSKKASPSTTAPALDLDKLQSMAIELQGNLGLLAALAVDELIHEMDILIGPVE